MIEVGKEYTIENSGNTTVVIRERIGHLYIATCGKYGAKYIFNEAGNAIAGFNSIRHLDANEPDFKRWKLLFTKPKVEVKLVYHDATVSDDFLTVFSLYQIPTTATAGFIKVDDGIPQWFPDIMDLEDRIEKLLK